MKAESGTRRLITLYKKFARSLGSISTSRRPLKGISLRILVRSIGFLPRWDANEIDPSSNSLFYEERLAFLDARRAVRRESPVTIRPEKLKAFDRCGISTTIVSRSR